MKSEIVAVVPLKAERAPVPGAEFSPEAVSGNLAEMKNTRTVSHSSGISMLDVGGLKYRNLFHGRRDPRTHSVLTRCGNRVAHVCQQ